MTDLGLPAPGKTHEVGEVFPEIVLESPGEASGHGGKFLRRGHPVGWQGLPVELYPAPEPVLTPGWQLAPIGSPESLPSGEQTGGPSR